MHPAGKCRLVLSVGLMMAACALFACSGKQAPSPAGTGEPSGSGLTVITIGTADAGGTMAPAGQAIADAIAAADPTIRVNVNASTGSVSNIQSLRSGEIDLGLVSGDAAWRAYNGSGDFSGNAFPGLRAVAALYSSTSDWMAPDAVGIRYVHDLKGHVCAIGPENSATDMTARDSLRACGISIDSDHFKNISIGEGSSMAIRGEIDAVHGFAGNPISGLADMADAAPSRLLLYTESELNAILDRYPYYEEVKIPAGTYKGQNMAVTTFGVKCLLCVSSAADKEKIQHLAEILDHAAGDLASAYPYLQEFDDDLFRYSAIPIPLHEGALAYYQQRGYIDSQ